MAVTQQDILRAFGVTAAEVGLDGSTPPPSRPRGPQAPESWETHGHPDDSWKPSLRGRCTHCGRLVPSGTIRASRSYEYDDWEIYGVCGQCGEVDIEVVDTTRRR